MKYKKGAFTEVAKKLGLSITTVSDIANERDGRFNTRTIEMVLNEMNKYLLPSFHKDTPHGLQTEIISHTTLKKTTVSKYFNGKYIGEKYTKIIENYLDSVGKSEFKNEKRSVRKVIKLHEKRVDIIRNLVSGDLKKLSEKLNIEQSNISLILYGDVNQNTKRSKKVIREAELMAATNIWKEKYCKHKSLL